MRYKRTVCAILGVLMLTCLFPAGGYAQEQPAPSSLMEEAVGLGLAWEGLLGEPERPVTAQELVSLMENALAVMDKADANGSLLAFSDGRSGEDGVQRYELAQLIYGVYQDVTAGHSFPVNASVIYYEVGGGFRGFRSWEDCPDYEQINELTRDDMVSCDYAMCAFDRTNGDKLMPLYDDWTFRPTAEVTVREAAETVLRFSRSFEKDPVFVDVTDEAAGRHTVDPALYTGQTTLPDAANQDLPAWRGCNISFNSMYHGYGSNGGPDDAFAEANLDYIKELGMNYVRLRLTWSYFQGPDFAADNVVNLSRLEQLDEIISWCMERDIHVQLVFSDVPNLDYDADYDSVDDWFTACGTVFTDETVRDSVTAFWRMLARRYADIPNNYLSFNLMNECVPADDDNYVWAFADAVRAIWEESPGRVIVADVHAGGVTGAGMAEMGCALSYHFYDIENISMVSAEKEAAEPGFYESITGMPGFVNANICGPNFGEGGPEANFPGKENSMLRFTGAVGGATLSVTIQELFDTSSTMQISADGQILYQVIFIDATMQRLHALDGDGEKKTHVVVGSPKSDAAVRVIPMSENVAALCRQIGDYGPECFILTGTEQYMEPRVVQFRMKKLADACGLEGVHFHTLRHTFATRSVEVGFELKSLSEVLGHAKTSTTLDLYVHASIDMKRSNMNKLAQAGL